MFVETVQVPTRVHGPLTLEQQALADLNEIRFGEFSLPPLEELPKGKMMNPQRCVIANGLPGGWSYYPDTGPKSRLGDGYWQPRYDLQTSALIALARAFDSGLVPHLIER